MSGPLKIFPARKLRETGGPAVLTVGDIGDGEFLKRVGGDVVSAAAGEATLSDDQFRYWLAKAALLDPDAVAILSGAFDEIVPDGEVWYPLSAWYARVNSEAGSAFGRNAPYTDLPSALPQGSRVLYMAGGSPQSFMYCNPSLVSENPGYDDPKTLYEKRMGILTQLPAQTIDFHVNSGGAADAPVYVQFPTHFERAIITHFDIENLSWMALFSTDGGYPLTTEISDFHATRIATEMKFPLKRSLATVCGIASGNISGAELDDPCVEGWGCLHYKPLPVDW